jgi:hypothetical protein
MADLRAYQEDLKKLIFLKETETGESLLWGKVLPERLKVYRSKSRTNWTDALDSDFPLTRSQFSADEWRALRTRYFSLHPPRHWELNHSIQPFAKFIAGQKVAGYVKELADYEWHDLKIFIDRSVVRPGSGLTNPTAVTRVYQFQMFDWVQARAPRDRPPKQKPEVLVFYRDSRNTCHVLEAEPLMLLLMDHFRKPGTHLADLEPIRRRLLPNNTVPLEKVAAELKEIELLLL